ncbi:hypothetical protein GGQ92_000767 [Gracilibacillus halotolerans]|uniref:DISARM protein DrmE C-terminal domain-containing protein n=1 Tax=Gracilibacillus halotolerans TaxID=74386 RepID=A0A841RDE7_9BACI|nr:hypothetical protein [Gracilibacillus halotolerans]MBB6512000.1 hypothetical protein [Gracilibacillus halotolerans]
MSFSNLVDLYRLESNIVFSHVKNRKLSSFAEYLDSYRKEVQSKYDSDQHLNEVLNFLRRVFFKLVGSFMPYNKVISEEVQNELLKRFHQIKNSYPELFSSLVIEIAKTFKDIAETNENSMVEYLQNYINNLKGSNKIAIVTKRALTVEEKNKFVLAIEESHKINYYTENSFRKEINIYDEVLYIGSPNYFGEYVRTIFKGLKTIFVSYDMFANSMSPKSGFKDIDTKGVYSTIYEKVVIGKPIEKEVLINFEEKELLNNAVNKLLDEQISSISNSSDAIEASIVYLENDRFLFAPQDSKIRVFFPEEKRNFIKQKNFKDLEEDDYIVVRNESDTKLIAEVADQILGSKSIKYRDSQKRWKKRLRYNVEKKGINRVSQILSRKYGLKTASTVSIRNWCNEDSISPTELQKLLRALKFTENEIKEIYSRMQEIRRAHLKAGRLISTKLMSELSTEILHELKEQGYYTFTSREFNGASFNIERVVSIEFSSYLIAPYNLMKAIEID